jgi:hypothetical protein
LFGEPSTELAIDDREQDRSWLPPQQVLHEAMNIAVVDDLVAVHVASQRTLPVEASTILGIVQDCL